MPKCKYCSEEFKPNKYTPNQIFCSKKCGDTHFMKYQRKSRSKGIYFESINICQWCNKQFKTARNSKFCSETCRSSKKYADKKEKYPEKVKAERRKSNLKQKLRLKAMGEAGTQIFKERSQKYRDNMIAKFLSGDRAPYWRSLVRRKHNEKKKRKITVNISPEDLEEQWLKQKGYCNYLGTKLRPFTKKDQDLNVENAISVDQIIPGKGYNRGNIQFVSLRANMIKSDDENKYLVELLEVMLDNTKKLLNLRN